MSGVDDVAGAVRALEAELRPLRARAQRIEELVVLRRDLQHLEADRAGLQNQCRSAEGMLLEARQRLDRAKAALGQQRGWVPEEVVKMLMPSEQRTSWRKSLRFRPIASKWAGFAVLWLLLCVLLDWVGAI
ncbi:MAG: hypothetical protein ACJ790_00725 [Myxococcaceae bacterium]